MSEKKAKKKGNKTRATGDIKPFRRSPALLGAVAFGCAGILGMACWLLLLSAQAKAEFDGGRAYKDLENIVAIGPRPSGSEGLARLRTMIGDELKKAGLDVQEQSFTADTPDGKIPMVNITGIVKGSKPGVIILGNHYETKLFKDIVFVGANDGGSTTAWMMEMARTLGGKREGRSVWLCFFDGEEAFREWSKTDSLYGSRAYVQGLKEQGKLANIHAMINVDMIGDCALGIKRDSAAPAWLTDMVWKVAEERGHAARFLAFGQSIADDHVPFREAGIPAMDIIDFNYGATLEDHARYWHTSRDTIERVCAESLQTVGDVVYHALPRLDAVLDKATGK
jgi:Zn-dependent M28 family amino/carboxypeptidase